MKVKTKKGIALIMLILILSTTLMNIFTTVVNAQTEIQSAYLKNG